MDFYNKCPIGFSCRNQTVDPDLVWCMSLWSISVVLIHSMHLLRASRWVLSGCTLFYALSHYIFICFPIIWNLELIFVAILLIYVPLCGLALHLLVLAWILEYGRRTCFQWMGLFWMVSVTLSNSQYLVSMFWPLLHHITNHLDSF